MVGKNVPPVVRNLESMREINLIEQQANDTVDEINKVKEHLKILMEVNIFRSVIYKYL